MNGAIQTYRNIPLGPIEILRYGLAGVLFLLSAIWELLFVILRWTLFVLLWVVGFALIMCGVVLLLFFGGPIGIGLLVVASIIALRWCLKEDY
jgi:hypothetical protein